MSGRLFLWCRSARSIEFEVQLAAGVQARAKTGSGLQTLLVAQAWTPVFLLLGSRVGRVSWELADERGAGGVFFEFAYEVGDGC